MNDLFYVLAIICSVIAVVVQLFGMADKISSKRAWQIWGVAMSLYVVFISIALGR